MRILFRLTLYFVISSLIFSLAMGALFNFLFYRHNLAEYKSEMGKRAEYIAESAAWRMDMERSPSPYMREGEERRPWRGGGEHHGDMERRMRFMENVSRGDVWIVDTDLKQITFGRRRMDITYKDLPVGAESVITEALTGKTAISDSFSKLLGAVTITAAAPILGEGGKPVAVALVHGSLADVRGTTNAGLHVLLLSLILGGILSAATSFHLSSRFIRPLKLMKETALALSKGDFTAKTGVKQRDEIGGLARVMDDMSEKLLKASRESENTEKLRRDFVANVSHELRTPVTVLKGSLEALIDGVVSGERVGEYLGGMLSETLYLERLVNDLLELSRLQNAGFAIEKSAVCLNEALEDAVRAIGKTAEKKGVKIECKNKTDRALTLQGDYGRLRQMFLTVLDNSVKFSPKGGTIEVELDGEAVLIRDFGTGIAPSHLPHIFERFYKERSEENKEGTGLGLAIAQEIAKRHAINISAASEQGVKTEFLFRLPKYLNNDKKLTIG